MRLRTLLVATTAGALTAGGMSLAVPRAGALVPPSPDGAGSISTWGNPNATYLDQITIPSGPDGIETLGPIVDVAAGTSSTAVVSADGRFRIWGKTSASDVNPDNIPTAAKNATDAISIVLNAGRAILTHRDNTVTAWGGTDGLISMTPEGLRAKAVAISPTGAAYAVTTDGHLVQWGATPSYPTPSRVSELTDIVDVAVGTFGGLVLRENKTVVAWGMYPPGVSTDDYGVNSVPNYDDGSGRYPVQIAAGNRHDGIVFSDGSIMIWGGAQTPATPPDFAAAGKKVKALTLSSHAAALTEDATGHRSVELWGSGASTAVYAPEREADLEGKPIAEIAMSDQHAIALTTVFRQLAVPTIAGTVRAGETLHATPARFSLTPTASAGQWLVDNEPVAGQGNDLLLTSEMIGKKISYRTTASLDGTELAPVSAETAPVDAAASTVTLAVTPASAPYGTARTVKATVTSGIGTPTGTVTFKAGTLTATKNLTAGAATWALPAALAVGTTAVTAEYSGDASTSGSTATAQKVTVSKNRSSVAGTAKVKGKTKKVAKKVTLTVTVHGVAKVSPTGKVTVLLKGKKGTKRTTATVNARGIATATLKKVKRGTYTLSLDYAGNGTVAGSKSNRRIKI